MFHEESLTPLLHNKTASKDLQHKYRYYIISKFITTISMYDIATNSYQTPHRPRHNMKTIRCDVGAFLAASCCALKPLALSDWSTIFGRSFGISHWDCCLWSQDRQYLWLTVVKFKSEPSRKVFAIQDYSDSTAVLSLTMFTMCLRCFSPVKPMCCELLIWDMLITN